MIEPSMYYYVALVAAGTIYMLVWMHGYHSGAEWVQRSTEERKNG